MRDGFCERCAHRVHDLSSMREDEAKRFLDDNHDVCVRFTATRDGNIRFRAAAVAAAVTIAVSGAALASGSPTTPTVSPTDAAADAGADAEVFMGRKSPR